MDGSLFEKLLNKYRQADKQFGGWLPGGGTASPVTRPIQERSKKVAGKLRDQLVVPIIDKGIETGALPTKEAMFARYLTGTSKPLTVYPKPLVNQISDAYEQVTLASTKEDVDRIFKQQNPLYRQYEIAKDQYNNFQRKLSERAEMHGIGSSIQEQKMLDQYELKRNKLRESLGLNRFTALDPELSPPTLSNQERLNIIQKNNLLRPGNVTVNYEAAYNIMPPEVGLSLGRFNIRNNTIEDRYKFDNLQHGRFPMPEYGINPKDTVYPDALGGGRLASDLIELGLKTGIINPKSGYDIRIPYSK
jgi:hypothetical protein